MLLVKALLSEAASSGRVRFMISTKRVYASRSPVLLLEAAASGDTTLMPFHRSGRRFLLIVSKKCWARYQNQRKPAMH